MIAFLQAATVLLPLVYVLTSVLFGMAFGGDRAPEFASRLRGPLLGLALLLHAALLTAHAVHAGQFPVREVWLVISCTALVMALLYALLGSRSQRPAVGALVVGTATLLQTLASAFGPMHVEPAEPLKPGTILHVVTVSLASAALVLSGLYGYLHLTMLRQMRNKRFGPVYRQLPDLEQLAHLTRGAALAGFLFLTVGLNVGIALGHQRVARFDYLDPQVLLTMVVWVHFGLIAFSRHIRGWTARRASIAAVAGLVTLLLTIALTLIPAVKLHRLS